MDNRIEWTPDLSVGVNVIDNDHRELMSRANRLAEAVTEGRGGAEIAGLLDFLEVYVTEHFGREEALMVAEVYPGYEKHRGVHEGLRCMVGEMRAKLDRDGHTSGMAQNVRQLCNVWIADHIARMDKELGIYIIAREEDAQEKVG